MHRPSFPRLAATLATALLLAACAGGSLESARHPAEAPINFTPPPSPAAVALENASALSIGEPQRITLLGIRRELDSLTAPLRVRLDSLHPTQRPVNPRDLSPEQRAEIQRRRSAAGTIMEEWARQNAAARPRVLALLTAEQQARLAELEEEARRRIRERQEELERAEERRMRGMGRSPY